MRYIGISFVLLAVLVAPNLIWLGTSTVRVHNSSGATIYKVGYSACETVHVVGSLDPGESVFRFLEACGDDTLEILIGDSAYCQSYVEGELYHVDATIGGDDDVRCRHDDLLSSLFIYKMLR